MNAAAQSSEKVWVQCFVDAEDNNKLGYLGSYGKDTSLRQMFSGLDLQGVLPVNHCVVHNERIENFVYVKVHCIVKGLGLDDVTIGQLLNEGYEKRLDFKTTAPKQEADIAETGSSSSSNKRVKTEEKNDN